MADALIDAIYEAAVVPEHWPQVLDQLVARAGGWAAALVAIDLPIGPVGPPRENRVTTTARYAEAYRNYTKHGADVENVRPKRALASQAFAFQADIELCTLEELRLDPIYTRFLHPYGIGWTAGTTIAVPSADLVVFDLCRRIEDGPFDKASLSRLTVYRPHLARAAFVAARLGLERARAAAATLQALGLPCAAMRSTGRVLATNPLFDALAPRLAVGARDRISIGNADVAKEVLAGLGSVEPRSIPIPSTATGPALILHVVPIRRAAREMFSGVDCLLVVTPVVSGPAPNAGVLMGLFDLSPAEAKFARALATGSTLAAFARANGVTYETARSQLKSVMAKTGTHRQADLARLLATAAPVTMNSKT